MDAARNELAESANLPYSYPVDLWAMGCMLIELATGEYAFQADCSIDLLFQQFRLRGTPTEDSWPGISLIARAAFSSGTQDWPRWRPKALRDVYPDVLPADGLNLLDQLLCVNPARRITAADALLHPFFDPLDKAKLGAAPLPEMASHGPIYAAGVEVDEHD